MNFDLEVAAAYHWPVSLVAINVSGGETLPYGRDRSGSELCCGGIVGGMIYNSAITILQYTLVLLIWLILVMTLKWLRTNMLMKHLIDGRPIIVIDKGNSAC